MLRILPMPVAQYKIDGKDLFTSIQMQDYAIDCQEAAKEEALAPQKREWVGLTEAEILEIAGGGITRDERMIAYAVAAELKEKNT